LVLVLSYVGFLAAYRNPLGFDPFLAGFFGATLTAWVTFVPCFLWIFLGAPYVEILRSNRALSGALTALSAAVVGVIANLALWFSLHVLFAEVRTMPVGPVSLSLPVLSSLNSGSAILSVIAFLLIFRLKMNVPTLLALCGLGGVALSFANL
jgi:chromate transporter